MLYSSVILLISRIFTLAFFSILTRHIFILSSEKCKCDNVILLFFTTTTIIIVDDENDTAPFYVCDDYDWT